MKRKISLTYNVENSKNCVALCYSAEKVLYFKNTTEGDCLIFEIFTDKTDRISTDNKVCLYSLFSNMEPIVYDNLYYDSLQQAKQLL